MVRLTRLTQVLRLLWQPRTGGGTDPALTAGIVLLDSDDAYLMDASGAVLYAADELFTTADGSAFGTADGTLYGVPA